MPTLKDLLPPLPARRVLDVATGGGAFIERLIEILPNYTEIVGIDTSQRAGEAFGTAFKDQSDIRFEWMDAIYLSFEDASFDLVCISNSLHHFEDPRRVLTEMKRVLRPGGYFLISEMYSDHQTETQLTHVYLHHWWAAVDSAQGIVHRTTYPRQQLVDLVAGVGLCDLELHDLYELDDDPKDPEGIAALNGIIDRYIERAAGRPDLQAQGEQLRQRVSEVGFHNAATLITLGKKG
jgi:SAM-dependent methyltransferase